MNDAMTSESLPSPTTRHSGFADSLKRQLCSALPKCLTITSLATTSVASRFAVLSRDARALVPKVSLDESTWLSSQVPAL